MTLAKQRPEKTKDGFSIIYDAADIPTFIDEAGEAAYWDTHSWSEELLERFEQVPLEGDEVFPPARPRGVSKRPVSIRFDEDTMMRLKQLAGKKHTNYQTLVKNFVNERLYEEEKREGILQENRSDKDVRSGRHVSRTVLSNQRKGVLALVQILVHPLPCHSLSRNTCKVSNCRKG